MAKIKNYKNHIKKSDDLVTSKEQTRAGFISLALEKNYLAVPYVEEAKALKVLARKCKSPQGLLDNKDLYPSLLSASGLSVKSLNYLNDEDQKVAIKGLIDEFLAPAGKAYADELGFPQKWNPFICAKLIKLVIKMVAPIQVLDV